MQISYLECTRCGEHLSADGPQNVCPKDGGVLFARYDLASLKGKLRRESLCGRVASMFGGGAAMTNPELKEEFARDVVLLK